MAMIVRDSAYGISKIGNHRHTIKSNSCQKKEDT